MQEIKIIESKYKEVFSTTCDICGLETKKGHGTDWSESYDLDDFEHVTVKHIKQTYYHYEGGKHVTVEYDICPDCFKIHIMDHLKTLCANPRVIEEEW